MRCVCASRCRSHLETILTEEQGSKGRRNVKSAMKTRMAAVATPEGPLVHCATRGSTKVFAKAISIGADTLEKRNLKAELPTGMDSVFSGGADCKATSAKVGTAPQQRTRRNTR